MTNGPYRNRQRPASLRRTLLARRDCDVGYLRRTEAFIRGQVQAHRPFFVCFNHSLMHMPVIPRAESKGAANRATWPQQRDADFAVPLDLSTTSAASDNLGAHDGTKFIRWRRFTRRGSGESSTLLLVAAVIGPGERRSPNALELNIRTCRDLLGR